MVGWDLILPEEKTVITGTVTLDDIKTWLTLAAAIIAAVLTQLGNQKVAKTNLKVNETHEEVQQLKKVVAPNLPDPPKTS